MIKIITTLMFSCFICLSPYAVSAQTTPTPMEKLDQEILKHKGKVIYLDFWASWCIPCRKSFPWMNEIQQKYASQKFTVISVNLDVEKSFALEFLEELPPTFPVLYDPQGQTARALKVKGMPASYLLNRQGKIVKGHIGFFRDKQASYETEIEDLLSAVEE